jgi:hypothetical protein
VTAGRRRHADVLVFREQRTSCDPRADLDELFRTVERLHGSRGTPDEWLTALIDAGEIHAASADALCPSIDDLHPAVAGLRDVTEAIALGWMDARGGSSTSGAAMRVDRARREASDLPSRAERSVPEGFAYYALYPEMYEAAARIAVRRSGAEDVAVVGIRSIGTTLAAVVAQAVRRSGARAWAWTVRPRGHPFDRAVQIGPALASSLAARQAGLFLIVDEGPGLSGSSFAAAAEAIRSLGVPNERIVLLPSYDPEIGTLKSERGRDVFRRHQVVTASFEDHVLAAGLHGYRRAELQDVSGGRWRGHVSDARRSVPVHPHHERRKYLAGTASQTLLVFEGLGRYGERAVVRAVSLAEAGFGPAPSGFHRGFLSRRWESSATVPTTFDAAMLERIGTYLGWVGQRFATGQECDIAPTAEMLQTNAGEALGEAARLAAGRLTHDANTMSGPAAWLDGRMQWQEWLLWEGSLVKVDALHHHDDHFFPGACDPAWDLAGAIVELALDTEASRSMLDGYEAACGDSGVQQRLPFFVAAYAAFRVGYTAMAAESLGETEDGRRFASARRRYERALRRALLT